MTEHTERSAHPRITISIDGQQYTLRDEKVTGAELRALPKPDVPADRDLWLETPGPKDDILIRPEKKYEIKSGSVFYTAPSNINPGSSHAG